MRKAHLECVTVAQKAIQSAALVGGSALLSIPLANSLCLLGRYEEAEKVARRGIDVLCQGLPPELSCVLIKFKIILAESLAYRHNYKEAGEALQGGLELIRTCSNKDDAEVQETLSSACSVATLVYEDAGLLDKAVEVDSLVLELATGDAKGKKRILAEPDRIRREALVLVKQGKVDQAEAELRSFLEHYQRWYEANTFLVLPDQDLDGFHKVLALLADVLEKRGKADGVKLAKQIRAEVAQQKAIEDGLRAALLTDTKDAAMLVMGEWAGADSGAKAGKKKKGSKAVAPKAKEGEESSGGGGLCSICTLELDVGGSAVATTLLPCGHQFHSCCLDLWLDRCSRSDWSSICPTDKAPIIR